MKNLCLACVILVSFAGCATTSAVIAPQPVQVTAADVPAFPAIYQYILLPDGSMGFYQQKRGESEVDLAFEPQNSFVIPVISSVTLNPKYQ